MKQFLYVKIFPPVIINMNIAGCGSPCTPPTCNEKLSALVRVLKLGNGQGNKAALVAALAARVGDASREALAAMRASIERGAAASDIALALTAPRAALPESEPESGAAATPPAVAPEEPLPLARRRPRRGA